MQSRWILIVIISAILVILITEEIFLEVLTSNVKKAVCNVTISQTQNNQNNTSMNVLTPPTTEKEKSISQTQNNTLPTKEDEILFAKDEIIFFDFKEKEETPLSKQFDQLFEVYFINLEESEQRRKNLLERFKERKMSVFWVKGIAYGQRSPTVRRIVPEVETFNLIDRYPKLPRGQVGLLLSNLKCYDLFLRKSKKPWLMILEDDAIIPPDFKQRMVNAVMREMEGFNILDLDSRGGSDRYGTGGEVFPRKTVSELLHLLHPFSEHWENQGKKVRNGENLELPIDHSLGYLGRVGKLKNKVIPIVRGDGSTSQLGKKNKDLESLNETFLY